jgi:IS30 family transposase
VAEARVRRRGARNRERHAAYVDLVAAGVNRYEAGRQVGVSRSTVRRWHDPEFSDRQVLQGQQRAIARAVEQAQRLHEIAGVIAGLPPRAARGRYLELAERLVIADLRVLRYGIREIGRVLERAASTVSREVRRNSYQRPQPEAGAAELGLAGLGRLGAYAPHAAQVKTEQRRRRPKDRKLEKDPGLWAHVIEQLTRRWSPEQIARRLPRVFPDQPERRLCHETIYQALFVQPRGELRKIIAGALRRGRVYRRARHEPGTRTPREQGRGRFKDPMVMISERPAEATDRAVPGHWEGDLIIGEDHASAIATLVERTTRYTLLVALPEGREADHVRDQLLTAVATLPAHLRRSLTWDQGAEMASHRQFALAADMPVYFCDPHSPWMRGSNENTNGLLRQYFPKGTDLAVHTPAHLAAVAAELNGRPRKTLDWDTPAERLATVLGQAS